MSPDPEIHVCQEMSPDPEIQTDPEIQKSLNYEIFPVWHLLGFPSYLFYWLRQFLFIPPEKFTRPQ
jgi:hypothetical protein